MAFAPSGRGRPVNPGQVDPADLIHVRKLYLEKRYKQCIAACEEHLKEQLHPVHQAFLLFQQALSYEAMGLGAHKYSRNKIPSFELAEEKFLSILEILEPRTEGSLIEDVPSSPVSDETPQRTPTRLIQTATADALSDSSSVYSSHSDQTAIFDGFSPKRNGLAGLGSIPQTVTGPIPQTVTGPIPQTVTGPIPRTVTFLDVHKQDQVLNPEDHARDNHESQTEDRQHLLRLTASLSSTHILADELVPEPLFTSRANKPIVTQSSQSTSISTPAPRCLPRSLGNLLQTPSARSLLPSPLQNTPLSCYTDASLPSSAASTVKPDIFATPITPRFELIHSIFANPRSETDSTDSSDLPSFNSCPSSPYSRTNVGCSNTALTTFLTAVRSSLAATRSAIISTQELQDEHAAAKRRAFIASSSDAGKRMASLWLLDAPTTPRTTAMGRGRGVRTGMVGNKDREDPEDEAARKQKQERIEKLRAADWQVNKEKFGWKGMAHYDTLLREVDFEIRLGVGGMGVKQEGN
ncbi:hypothetical protein DV735_g5178, partial [Chaetothyriales sp. CBS 134920]